MRQEHGVSLGNIVRVSRTMMTVGAVLWQLAAVVEQYGDTIHLDEGSNRVGERLIGDRHALLHSPRTVLADVPPLVPDAYASPSAPASSVSVSAGAAGTFAALSVAAGLWFASKAIPRRPHIAHTLPVRAAAVASGSAMSK